MLLALAFIMPLFRLRSLTPLARPAEESVAGIYQGEIVIPSVHLILMYVFNFSYNYLTIIRIGPLPLGILLLHLAALGSSTGAYLIL